ncbi:MAG: septal ring lytic transglycosylase RlpA family protein [Alphaproteobacteria bacterium]
MRMMRLAAMLLLPMGLVTGCAEVELATHIAKQVPLEADRGGHYKVGRPYKIKGTWYHPKEDFNYVETGVASWYGPGFHGRKTANGELYNQNYLTAAHRTLPMPSLVRVTNLENGRSIIVRVNDRGPFAHNRIIDMSARGAELLGFRTKGLARVKVEILPEESRQLAKGQTPRLKGGNAPAYLSEAPVLDGAPNEVASNSDGVPLSARPLPAAPVAEPVAPVTQAALSSTAQAAMVQPAMSSAPIGAEQAVLETGGAGAQTLWVQAGSFANKPNADALASRLAALGPVTTSSVNVSGRTYWRVRLGPDSNIDAADSALARTINVGQSQARLVVEE